MSRIRIKSNVPQSGTWTLTENGSVVSSGGVQSVLPGDRCVDTNHAPRPYEDGGLHIMKHEGTPALASGKRELAGRVTEFSDIPYYYVGLPQTETNWFQAEAKVAQLQHSAAQPVVDVGSAIAESASIIGYMQKVGGTLQRLSDLARGLKARWRPPDELYLLWEFGYKPFIDDLQSVHQAASLLADRMEHLRRDRREGRRSGDLPPITTMTSPTMQAGVVDGGASVFLRLNQVTTLAEQRTWFTSRIQVTDELDGAIARLANKPPDLGLAPSEDEADTWHGLTALWNAIPFSFLVDYFVDVQSLLATTENRFPMNLVEVNLMNEITLHTKSWFDRPNPAVFHDMDLVHGEIDLTIKQRHYVHKPTNMLVPESVLTAKQMANITAVASVLGKPR